MKGTVLILLALAAGSVRAEFYDFTDIEGRRIEAEILMYDASGESVVLRTRAGKRSPVPMSRLCEADRVRVKQWFIRNEFLSDRKFSIGATPRKGEKRENAGETMYTLHEDRYYEIELVNRTAAAFEDLKVEYAVYYEQDEVNQSAQNVAVEGIYRGELNTGLLERNATWEQATDSVVISEYTLDDSYYYTSGRLNHREGKVIGIWVRVFLDIGDGDPLMREFCTPGNLNEREWPSESRHVGENRRKKQSLRNREKN